TRSRRPEAMDLQMDLADAADPLCQIGYGHFGGNAQQDRGTSRHMWQGYGDPRLLWRRFQKSSETICLSSPDTPGRHTTAQEFTSCYRGAERYSMVHGNHRTSGQ